ncbi:MAG: peptide ABC transporter substrate-binding protein [Anaerolineaceae bacterium]|jgi:oligopeptide transport system substrate-binding protein
MRSKSFILFAALIIASLVLSACQPTAAPAPETPQEPETIVHTVIVEGEVREIVVTATPDPAAATPAGLPLLRINLGTYPDIIDPQKSSFVNEIAHLMMIYEGLTRLDENLETVPGAAESWEYNDDATQLTFTLREGLKYSDGVLLNAARFHYSLMRNINPETAGEYAGITDDILGAAAWRGGEVETNEGVGVHAYDMAGNLCEGDYENADCRKLVIDLERPAPYFHTVMSLWVVFPAREELIGEGGDIWWTSSKFQIGNGPFVLSALEPFVRGHFIPNPNYWRGQPSYDMEFRYITDTAVQFEAYKNDEFDIAILGAEDLATVEADPVLNAEKYLYAGSCTFAFNLHHLKEPFSDMKVREAFIYALDRESWVKDVLKGMGSPTLTWIPPGFPGYDDTETRYAFDPEKAKQAIAESSYGSIENLPPITATFSDTPRNRTRWEWLAAKYKEILGVDIALNPVESTTFTALTKDVETAPQMYILGWCADYPDPQNWLSVFWMTGAFGQRFGFGNAELDTMMRAADATLDPEERMALYHDAQKFLIGLAPGAMFWNNVNSYLVKPWVTGIKYTPMDAGFPGIYEPLSIQVGQPNQ